MVQFLTQRLDYMAKKSEKKVLAPRGRTAGSRLRSQTDRALVGLRKLVLEGHLRPNQRIPENKVATRLGVSRTPIRHALDCLAREGLLEPIPAGGLAVRTFTVVEICDAIEMRAVLEGTAARLASERIVHPQELELLRGYERQIQSISQTHLAGSQPDIEFFNRYCELNRKFHTALMDLSRSAVLRRIWEQIQSVPFAAPSSTILPEAIPQVLKAAREQHQALLDALSRHDGEQAEMIARAHVRLAFGNLDLALRSSRPGASRVQVTPSSLPVPGAKRGR
jgi:GntR family transcriptional regulator of vanillate catabolism